MIFLGSLPVQAAPGGAVRRGAALPPGPRVGHTAPQHCVQQWANDQAIQERSEEPYRQDQNTQSPSYVRNFIACHVCNEIHVMFLSHLEILSISCKHALSR